MVSATVGNPTDPTDGTGAGRTASAVARCGGVTAWLVATTGAIGLGVDALGGSTTPTAAVGLLLGLSATALAAGLAGRDAAGAALVAAVATLLGAVALAPGTSEADVVATTVALAAGALALGLASLVTLDRDRPWTAPLVVAGTTVAALALVPLRAVVTVLATLADSAATGGTGSAGQPLVDRLAASSAITVEGALPTVATLLQLASVALLGGALWTLRRRAGVALLTAVGVAVALVLPVVADLTVGTTALGLGLLVAAGAVVLAGRPDEPTVLAAEAVLVPVLLAVAVASAPLAVAATMLVTVLAAALAGLAVRPTRASAPAWVGGALTWLLGSVASTAPSWVRQAAAPRWPWPSLRPSPLRRPRPSSGGPPASGPRTAGPPTWWWPVVWPSPWSAPDRSTRPARCWPSWRSSPAAPPSGRRGASSGWCRSPLRRGGVAAAGGGVGRAGRGLHPAPGWRPPGHRPLVHRRGEGAPRGSGWGPPCSSCWLPPPSSP